MPRGKKVCPDCGTETGPRAFCCPKCNYDYNIQKGATKLVKKKHGKRVEDWKELELGDCIKVISGSGPYWPLKEPREDGTDREPMGYSGLFKVHHKRTDGLLCYPLDKRNSGACFIYMGPERESPIGSILKSHKIRKVERKYIDAERRKESA